MGKGGAGKQAIVDYTMSIHFRVATSEFDELLAIYVGEKEAWSGSVTSETDIVVARPDLFGGVKKEGGVSGTVRYLPGGPDQVMPEHLAARLGLTTATCPGYRGMASLFFTGNATLFGSPGFLWSSNNPYLKTVWAKGRRRSRGLDPAYAFIGDRKDSNPIHVIYECLTNPDWGQGGAPTTIDKASFETAAVTVFNEGLGTSLMWTKQTDVESFCQELQDHIQATVFVHPRTGLMTIKLIRGDYDIADLPILNADNCKILSFDRKGLGETINEIVATYTNPENEQEETITAQNNANIALQGGIISDSRNYYAFRSVELAQWAAYRDLRTASAPLASFEIEADRSAWDYVPGGCARLQMPEYGFNDIVLRLGKIDYGKPGSPAIKLSSIEDIFGEDAADYDSADGSQWIDPAEDPSAPAFARLITAPAFLVTQTLRAADTQLTAYPEVMAAALVSQTNNDSYSYDLFGIETLPNGEVVADVVATRPMLGHCLMPTALVAQPMTVTQFGVVLGGPGPLPGGLVFIGNIGEKGQEIALLQSVDETGWTLKRGVLDTVPRAWPAGTAVWFINGDSNVVLDNVTYAAGETVATRVAASTSRGTVPFDDATPVAVVMTGRPHLPNRPANVSVAGVTFGTADLSGSTPATVPVTWSTRNRTLEDSQILAWTDGPVVPEAGQTTTVRVFSTTGTVITTHAGLTGNSFDLPVASLGGQAIADVGVYASRDGLDSLQGHRVRVKIRDGGWGDNWGMSWGGGSEIPAGDPNPEPVPPDPEPDPDQFPGLPPWKHQQLEDR